MVYSIPLASLFHVISLHTLSNTNKFCCVVNSLTCISKKTGAEFCENAKFCLTCAFHVAIIKMANCFFQTVKVFLKNCINRVLYNWVKILYVLVGYSMFIFYILFFYYNCTVGTNSPVCFV